MFYDDYEQARLIGKNLTEYLSDIYRNKASYCVVLVSKHYRAKRWTSHEWRAAQARAFEEPGVDYILPIRMDDTELPGLLPTVGYISAERYSVQKIARLIHDKTRDVSQINATIRLAEFKYSKRDYDGALKLLAPQKFDQKVEALRIRVDAYGGKSEYRSAIRDLQSILDLCPEDFLAHFLLGIFYFRIGNFHESVAHYEAADALSPGHPTILIDLPAARASAAQGGKQQTAAP